MSESEAKVRIREAIAFVLSPHSSLPTRASSFLRTSCVLGPLFLAFCRTHAYARASTHRFAPVL
eukprot:3403094-Pleurochrysis_carterae.AAC.1